MIALRNVCKSFDGGRTRAVDDVSLDVPRGGFLAIVGESGSGKSTVVKTINRLVEPDTGTVQIDGRPADADPAHILRRRIGYVFQGVGLFPHLSVAENIGVTPRLLGWEPARIAGRVDELLDLVRLPRAYASRRPDALSGGQRQRVGIARALAAEATIVLLDEAFGALDPIIRADLGQDYRRLHEQLGLTTVMITHDVSEAVLLADRIAVMKDGRLLANGTPGELAAGDVDPYVRELMDAPRRLAERVAERLSSRDPGARDPAGLDLVRGV
ncbi:ABC transporter ATP-binding protein [Caulobacter sp. S45]|uniref:ATP-binding cassette domain-containing protein n=1 Tax=Caulobacter sp. S45 TaxID=1641861 RepID=UPI00131A9A9A|nr:ABC transporter ATP-binding protein [Caulobacter sp. S45]